MKYKLLSVLLLMFFFLPDVGAQEKEDIKQSAYALYNINHTDEAFELMNKVDDSLKDEQYYVILSNIYKEKQDDKQAIENLNKALSINPKYSKAYYNLACIYMEKRIYTKAEENFALAHKFDKNNPYILYNLASAQINLGEFKGAKRNLIKAIYLKNDEKNFYYNLIYVDKKLGKEKDANKLINFYNQTFTKK